MSDPHTQDRVKFSIENLLKEEVASLDKFTVTSGFLHILDIF